MNNEVQNIEQHIDSKTTKNHNPFIGLRPFREEDAHLFFGRDEQVKSIIDKLLNHHFVTLLGAAGIGKSSIIHAGVVPYLHSSVANKKNSKWEVIECSPGMRPFETLAEAILNKFTKYRPGDEDYFGHIMIITTILKQSNYGLLDVLEQYEIDINTNILFVIDQFEELFRFVSKEGQTYEINETYAFIAMLLATFQYDGPYQFYQILSIRSEHTGNFAKYPKLTEKINLSHYLIPQMSREMLRQAIEGPVAVGNGRMSERLIQMILEDLTDNPDQLPVFQHAMMRTWTQWVNNGAAEIGEIDVRFYKVIGRTDNALSIHAEEIYNNLDPNFRQITELIFKTICHKGSHGEGKRNPTRIREIAEINNLKYEEVCKVVDYFRAENIGLLLPSFRVPLNENSIIDVGHHKLITTWSRLEQWVDEEERSIGMYIKLSAAAEEHQLGIGALWTDPDLQQALNWYEKENPTLQWAERFDPAFERASTFLRKSKETDAYNKETETKNQQARLRNSRIISLIFGFLSLLLLLGVIFGWIQTQQAAENEKLAVQTASEAQRNETLAKKSEVEAKLAKEEADKTNEILKQQKEQLDKALYEANRQRLISLENERLAKESQDQYRQQFEKAKTAEAHALDATNNATHEKSKAERLRALATSKSMSIKSLQVTDKQLKGLLALHAFEFNKKNKGYEMDHDIYNGLYSAIRDFESQRNFVLKGHNGSVRKILFPKKDKMITTSGDGSILEWDLKDNSNRVIINLGRKAVSNRVIDISDDGMHLISGNSSNYIQKIDLKDDGLPVIEKLKVHNSRIWYLKYLSNDSFISAGADSLLMITQGGVSRLVTKLDYRVNDMHVSLGGEFVFLALNNGQVKIVGLEENTKRTKIIWKSPKRSAVTAISLRHDNKVLAVGQSDGNIILLNPRTSEDGDIEGRLVGFDSYITDLTFSKDSKILAAASRNGEVRIWFMDKLKEQPLVIKDHNAWVWSVEFDPELEHLYSGDQNGDIYRYELSSQILADRLCTHIRRDMTKDEWDTYVGNEDYQKICQQADWRNVEDNFFDY